MPPSQPFAILEGLQMPLRDAARGLMSVGGATRKAFEPAADLLPEPLRSGLNKAAHSLKGAGSQLIQMPIALDEIVTASQFAHGTRSDSSTRAAFTKVLGYAWQRLLGYGSAEGLLISETILSGHLAMPHGRQDFSGVDHAASVLRDILKSSAIGRPPGLSPAVQPEDEDEIGLLLVAIMVWLLSARASSMSEDARLLDLSHALVLASRADVLKDLTETHRLSKLLETASTHL